jgi:hypothetical protein
MRPLESSKLDIVSTSYKRSGILTGLVEMGNWFGLVWMGINLGETCQVVRQHWFKIGHES